MNQNKIIILIIFTLFFLICLQSKKTVEKFKRKRIVYQKNNKITKEYMHFQHNNVIVTKESFRYVLEYKKQLLKNITNLLHKLNIKFVIGHGNLIEYVRNKFIFHDDDIDIRMCMDDLNKWKKYCKNLNKLEDKNFNLKFDERIFDMGKQLFNGIQVELIKFKNDNKIREYKMGIHCDLVFDKVGSGVWIDYDIDFKKIKLTKYFGSKVYVPCKKDTHKVLSKEYGKSYMIPNFRNYDIH